MANEEKDLMIPPKLNVPSFRNSHAIAISGLIVVAAMTAMYLTGYFMIVCGAAVLALIGLLKFSQSRTEQHERAMSIPPGLLEMKQRLASLQLEPPIEPIALRGQKQLAQLEASLANASDILRSKLDPGELAYKRFESSLRAGTSAILAELQDAVSQLKLASAAGSRDAASEPMKLAATACLDSNEKALEAFMLATASIAAMETSSARVELPQAVTELKSIAARAKNLSIKTEE